MDFRRKVFSRRLSRLAYAMTVVAFITIGLVWAQPGGAQQATILNPQTGDTITSNTAVDLSQAGLGSKANYVINGTCHNADKVVVTIKDNMGTTLLQDVATVKGGVWEYNWIFTQGFVGTISITATPSLNGQQPAAFTPPTVNNVTIDNTILPALSLSLVSSSVQSSLYAGSGNAAGQFQSVGVRLRYYTNAANPIGKLSFSDTKSTSKTTYFSPGNALIINNDDPNGNQFDPANPSKVVPFTFTLGGATGLAGGINTIAAADISSANGLTVQRSIIIDFTPPNIDANLTASFPAQNVVRFTGKADDPDNGSGGARAPGGIAGVELVLQAPVGSTKALQHIPAHLTYGDNPSDPVTWTVDLSTSGLLPGNYQVYAVINDYAGNQRIDAQAVTGNLPNFTITPYSLPIDQKNAPTVGVTSPTTPPSVFLKGSPSISFSAVANATVRGDAGTPKLDYELHDLSGTLDAILTSGSGNGTISQIWDTTKSVDGAHQLYVKAVDAQKNPATSLAAPVNVFVDNTPPVLSNLAPPKPAFVRGDVSLSATVADNVRDIGNTITVSFDDPGNAANPHIGTKTFTADQGSQVVTITYPTLQGTTPVVTDGLHVIIVTATDKAGNVATSQINIIVDNTKPVVTSVTIPLPNAFLPGGNIAISGNIDDTPDNDPNDVITFNIYDGDPMTGALIATGKGTAPFTFSGTWDTSAVTENAHALTVVATDKAGNSSTPFPVNVTVDRTPPTAAITSAINGVTVYTFDSAGNPTKINEIVRDTVTLGGAYTESNLNSLTVTVDGQPIPTALNTSNKTFTATWVTSQSGNGPHLISITANDKAGNTNTTTAPHITAVVDNTDPIVTVTSPGNNTFVPVGSPVIGIISDTNTNNGPNAATFTFLYTKGTTTTTATVAVTPVNGLAITTLPGNIGGQDPTTLGATVTITLTGNDLASPPHQVTSQPVTITAVQSNAKIDEVDHTDFAGVNGPALIATDPADNILKSYVSHNLTVLGLVDIASLKQWTLTLSGNGISPITLGSDGPTPAATPLPSFSTLTQGSRNPFDTTTVPPGSYTLTLTATDASNLATTDSRVLFVENKAPTVNFGSLTPSDGAIVQNQAGSLITIDGTITEAHPKAHLKSWDILIDGKSQQNGGVNPVAGPILSFQPGVSASLAGNYLAPGQHTIQIVAVDIAGNQGTSPIRTLTIDNANPMVTISAPSDKAYVRGTVIITGNIADNNPLKWKLEAIGPTGTVTLIPDTAGTGTAVVYNWDTKDLTRFSDGVYTLKVTATDVAKNVGTSSITVTVDNTSPVATFTGRTPAEGSFVQNKGPNWLAVVADIAEVNPATQNLLLDGTPMLPPNLPNAISVVPGSGLTEGKHTFAVVATDKAGNTNSVDRDGKPILNQQRVFTVDNTPPTITFVSPSVASNSVTFVGSFTSVPIQAQITDNITDPSNALTYSVEVINAQQVHTNIPIQTAVMGNGTNSVAITANWATSNGQFPDGPYTIQITATDNAKNSITNTINVTVVNATPTAELRILAPATVVDELGVAKADYHSSLTLGPVQTVYTTGPRLDLQGLVAHYKSWSLSTTYSNKFGYAALPLVTGLNNANLTGTGFVTNPLDTSLFPSSFNTVLQSEGRFQLNLTATNARGDTTPGTNLNVVVDRTAPTVQILSPVGNNALVLPTSILNLVFKVGKPGFPANVIAPIQRFTNPTLVSAPKITMTVWDDALNVQVKDSGTKLIPNWDLAGAVKNPDLTQTAGAATVAGDAFNGYTVTWQIRISSTLFSAGRRYRIQLSNAADVVGNQQVGNALAYFTVNVN